MKSRRSLYLDDKLNARLDALAQKPGASRSSIVRAAVTAYLDREGANEVEFLFRERLDRISGQLKRIEHTQMLTIESVALFFRHQLGLSPQLNAIDQRAVQALGRDRFQAFVAQVHTRVAGGRSASADMIDRARLLANDDAPIREVAE